MTSSNSKTFADSKPLGSGPLFCPSRSCLGGADHIHQRPLRGRFCEIAHLGIDMGDNATLADDNVAEKLIQPEIHVTLKWLQKC